MILTEIQDPGKWVGNQEIEYESSLESSIADALRTAKASSGLAEEIIAIGIMAEEECGGHILFPEGTHTGADVSDRRRLRFLRGRLAACRALKDLGCAGRTLIPPGPGGRPVFPDGISGSISHCEGWSVGVAVRFAKRLSIGIDLVSIDQMRKCDISSLICSERERDWVHSGNGLAERLCMLFAAKEAIYKALYPSCSRYIEFKEVELSWHADEAYFRATLLPNDTHLNGFLSCIPVRRHAGMIFSCSIYRIV